MPRNWQKNCLNAQLACAGAAKNFIPTGRARAQFFTWRAGTGGRTFKVGGRGRARAQFLIARAGAGAKNDARAHHYFRERIKDVGFIFNILVG